MPGVRDSLYVRARAGLLDAAEALATHLDAMVLVGAQAVYMHTGDSDLAVAEYTTEADLAVSPVEIAAAPLLGDLLVASGFAWRDQPGSWLSPGGVSVDLLVPESLAGPGSRGARLGPHGKRVARRGSKLSWSTGSATSSSRSKWPMSGTTSPDSADETPTGDRLTPPPKAG